MVAGFSGLAVVDQARNLQQAMQPGGSRSWNVVVLDGEGATLGVIEEMVALLPQAEIVWVGATGDMATAPRIAACFTKAPADIEKIVANVMDILHAPPLAQRQGGGR